MGRIFFWLYNVAFIIDDFKVNWIAGSQGGIILSNFNFQSSIVNCIVSGHEYGGIRMLSNAGSVAIGGDYTVFRMTYVRNNNASGITVESADATVRNVSCGRKDVTDADLAIIQKHSFWI